MKEASGGIEPPIGQNIIKLISNLCFSVFVFSVLIFTVIAITYQPPDPWLESAPALTKFFTESENATFKIDNSVLKTGEDMQTGPSPAIPPFADTKPITEEVIEKAEELIVKSEAKTKDLSEKSVEKANKTESVSEVSEGNANKMEGVSEVSEGNANKMEGVVEKANKTQGVVEKSEEVANATLKPSGCEELKVVNCSDPRVLITVERFNLKLFKSLVFLEYQTPVNGSKPDECDIAWRFRNKKEKSWRKYRDFRRFQFTRGDNCVYKIVHAGSWHSGINARRPRIKFNATRSGGKSPKIAPQFRDDEINDTIPTLGSEMNFRKGRYLYYSRGGDYCKSMNHYMWSFLCGLGEAMYLNRTFVLDLSMCLSGSYNSHGKDEEGKDFRYYFDFEHLKEVASIVEEGEFLKGWRRWNRSHKKKLPVKKVLTHKVSPMQLKKDKSSIIWRHFDAPEPENYWYRVCEGQAAKYIQRPWHALWKSKRLMNIVTEISAQMDWDFDAVHVVRGEKAQNKELWPHLDADTSPDTLVAKLQGMVQSWRHLYIATNEPFYNYFDKLRSHYKVHLLDDYKALWGNTSEWYNETTLLNNRKPVEFDGYMRVAVDTEVFYRAKTRVETFYNLTSDCKDGINTC